MSDEEMEHHATVSALMDKLAPDERAIIQREIEAEPDEQLHRLQLAMVVHKLACLTGSKRTCPACGNTKPASAFSWWGQPCLTCETIHGARARRERERWISAATHGELWRCSTCGDDKPVTEYDERRHRHCKPCLATGNIIPQTTGKRNDAAA